MFAIFVLTDDSTSIPQLAQDLGNTYKTLWVPCDAYVGPTWFAHKGSNIILSKGFYMEPVWASPYSPAIPDVTHLFPISIWASPDLSHKFPMLSLIAQLFPIRFPC